MYSKDSAILTLILPVLLGESQQKGEAGEPYREVLFLGRKQMGRIS